MRRNIPTLEMTQLAMRAGICVSCSARPPGSEAWGPWKPRPCEKTCRVFLGLPELREVAKQRDPMLVDIHDVITREMRNIRNSARAGKGCKATDGLTRHGPKVGKIVHRLFGC